jgi:hypothetical protein
MIGSNNKNTVGTILFFTAAKLSEPKKELNFHRTLKQRLNYENLTKFSQQKN